MFFIISRTSQGRAGIQFIIVQILDILGAYCSVRSGHTIQAAGCPLAAYFCRQRGRCYANLPPGPLIQGGGTRVWPE